LVIEANLPDPIQPISLDQFDSDHATLANIRKIFQGCFFDLSFTGGHQQEFIFLGFLANSHHGHNFLIWLHV